MCLAGRPARVAGIGERLGLAPRMPALPAVLANPNVPISTPDVFRARVGGFSSPADLPQSAPDAEAVAGLVRAFGNDLTAAACAVAPAVGLTLRALEALPDTLVAGMSGSGGTCFALFPTVRVAQSAAAGLRRTAPGWWGRAVRLNRQSSIGGPLSSTVLPSGSST